LPLGMLLARESEVREHISVPSWSLASRQLQYNLLVCDCDKNRVQLFSLDGRISGKTITDLPGLVTSEKDSKVYILK